MDVAVTLFCVVTVMVVVSTPCASASKGEEMFDTLILVVRNLVQFGRLLSIMRRYVSIFTNRSRPTPPSLPGRLCSRRSGTSIFARPKPIDLSRPRSATAQDIDLSDEEDYDGSDYSRLRTTDVLFDASPRDGLGRPPTRTPPPPPRPVGPPPPEEDEDMWANVS